MKGCGMIVPDMLDTVTNKVSSYRHSLCVFLTGVYSPPVIASSVTNKSISSPSSSACSASCTCQNCQSKHNLAHHIIPLSKDGKDMLDNLVVT
jgi:5-methylcytosine-specific restriction endonuclease McrA